MCFVLPATSYWLLRIGEHGEPAGPVEFLDSSACADQFAPDLCLVLEPVKEMPTYAVIAELIGDVGPRKPGQHPAHAPACGSKTGRLRAFGKKTQDHGAIRPEDSAEIYQPGLSLRLPGYRAIHLLHEEHA